MSIEEKGMSAADIMNQLDAVQAHDIDYADGKAFGMVFNPSAEAQKIAKEAYLKFISTNGLDFSQFPSLLHLEKDIISSMLEHLGGGERSAGAFTSGGTESIILALKSARDHARKTKPHITEPEVVLPITAHAAHWKACAYLGLKGVRVPVREEDFRVEAAAVESAITPNTIAIVGSAPSYTYGVIDPIEKLGQLALSKDVWLHVDGCMGGMLLPFYRELGENVPPFDLSVEGVCSISTDLHKYGYSPKGASVVLYADVDMRYHQWFIGGQWLGYPMVNSTIQSTKSGGPLAAAWTVMKYFGKEGYRDLTKQHISATKEMLAAIRETDGARVCTEPDFCIFAFDTPGKSLFQVADHMNTRGWFVQPILGHGEFPASLHVTISYQNFGKTDAFINDLKASIEASAPVQADPQIAQLLEGLKQMPADALSPDFIKMTLQGFGLNGEALPDDGMAEINEALNEFPWEHRNVFLRYFVNGVF